jgi:hypothetical protein
LKSDAEAHTPEIPTSWEAEIKNITVQGHPRQKVNKGGMWQKKKLMRPHPNKKAGCDGHSCNPSYAGDINRRIVGQPALDKKHKPISEK